MVLDSQVQTTLGLQGQHALAIGALRRSLLFSSAGAVELFTTPLLIHLYLLGIDGGNGGVAAR